jgi:ATP-binding cassette subfamily A (ABC1) protein 3
MIKGLSISELVEQKEYLIKAFSLGEYSVVADHLSGGNKRKLCAGMAIIGAPSLLFLDELTTGVDPVAKINITRCLKNLPNHSILLTTQRMEEAEGLCEWIAIMIDGRITLLGNIQDLVKDHGEGLSLDLKLRNELDRDAMMNMFHEIVDERVRMNMVSNTDASLRINTHGKDETFIKRKVFEYVIKLEDKGMIVNFELRESSLEDVFIKHAA